MQIWAVGFHPIVVLWTPAIKVDLQEKKEGKQEFKQRLSTEKKKSQKASPWRDISHL